MVAAMDGYARHARNNHYFKLAVDGIHYADGLIARNTLPVCNVLPTPTVSEEESMEEDNNSYVRRSSEKPIVFDE
jgi:hypothetical protein